MPSWCSQTHSSLQHSEHVHWPKGTHPSVSDVVGYCRSSDLLTDVNYLHYLWDARQAISTARRACQSWSAPYDGSDPSPESFRCETPGIFIEEDDDYDEDIFPRPESSSVRSLAATPPPFLLSPTPSSAPSQAARPGSALDLEWDELFDDDDDCASPLPDRGGSEDPPASTTRNPPKHIQEMRRDATRLVRGSYVEEAEFEGDVLVYDLVARKDTEVATMDRFTPTTTQKNTEIVQKKKSPVKNTLASMLTTTGKTVLETVNNLMSTRRRSEDVGKEDKIRIEVQDMPKSPYVLSNGFHMSSNIFEIDNKYDYNLLYLNHLNNVAKPVEDDPVFCNGRVDTESEEQMEATQAEVPYEVSFSSDSFMFQYEELMRSLGAEPGAEEFTDDIGSFRRRVRALRRKLQREEEGEETRLCEEALCWEGGDEVGGVEMEEAERGEETRSNRIPLTGPFISVLLSRLENLLENSIAVNLLVTGILAQLASYPQPLLRGFLLGTDTSHAHANVRTLYQVLVSVRDQIESFMSERPVYPALVNQAWRFLLIKDQDKKIRERLQSGAADSSSDFALPNGSAHGPPLAPPLVLPPCPAVPPQAQSRVFAIVLYAEFLKELAAIAQEHSIAPDVQKEE